MQPPRKVGLLGQRRADAHAFGVVELAIVIEKEIVVGDNDSPRQRCRSTRSLRTARNSEFFTLPMGIRRLSPISSMRQPSTWRSRKICRSLVDRRSIAVERSLLK